jgi:hypothetical protein
LRIMKRVATVTLALAGAACLTLAGALPALADTSQAYILVSEATSSSGNAACGVLLVSAQVSSSGPGYVSAFVANSGTKTCTGWIERSANKGKTWTTISKRVAVPHAASGTFAKTADYYTGTDRVRPCYQYGTGKASCGSAVTLKASKAKDSGGSLPVSYVRTQTSISSSSTQCAALLASTTATKTKTSSVDAFADNFSESLTKAGSSCTAVVQVSANKGKSWKTVSGSHVVPAPASAIAIGFTATFADGTGHLARVCVALASSPKKQHCTKSW